MKQQHYQFLNRKYNKLTVLSKILANTLKCSGCKITYASNLTFTKYCIQPTESILGFHVIIRSSYNFPTHFNFLYELDAVK